MSHCTNVCQKLPVSWNSSVCVWRHLQVDFWRPESAELVTIDIDVDIRVPAVYLDIIHTKLQQSDMEHM